MPLQNDPLVASRYGYTYNRIERLKKGRSRIDKIHDHIFLFEVLLNSLIKNAVRGRGGVTGERLD